MALCIGAHLSISKGLPQAVRQTTRIGGDSFGFHTRNPRGSGSRTIPPEERAEFAAAAEGAGLAPPVGHLPYVINLGSERDIWDFGVRVVGEDLRRCDEFGARAIVLHPGHHTPGALERGLDRVVAGVRAALEAAGPGTCLLCLEGMAGQTGEIGSRPEELGAILEGVGPNPRLGVCLDTCHLFAAGWDIRTHAGIDAMLAAYAPHVGLQRLRVLHLNDSKFPLGSHRDRHERLGQGEIGRAGLTAVLTHPVLAALPMIIETPVEDYDAYAGEISTARRLAEGG